MENGNHQAYNLFVGLRADKTGQRESDIQAEITPETFEDTLRRLYQRYMNREFTFGKMADLLGVPSLNLVDILDEYDLPMRHS